MPPLPSTFTVGLLPVSQWLSHRRPGLGAVCQKLDSPWMTGLAGPCLSFPCHNMPRVCWSSLLEHPSPRSTPFLKHSPGAPSLGYPSPKSTPSWSTPSWSILVLVSSSLTCPSPWLQTVTTHSMASFFLSIPVQQEPVCAKAVQSWREFFPHSCPDGQAVPQCMQHPRLFDSSGRQKLNSGLVVIQRGIVPTPLLSDIFY